jgi:hypothetical protein
MFDRNLAGQGRNIITVAVCSKCGRGIISKNAAVDTQPVWFIGSGGQGPMCNGQVMHVDRMKQIERIYTDAIETGPIYIIDADEI